MAEVEILSGGTDTPADDDVLELGEAPETVVAADGDDKVEPIDDFPDTLDDDDAVEETSLIKQLREKAKIDAREKRDQAAEIARLRGQTAPVRTKKPDLYDDCEGDIDKYDAASDAWKANEAAVAEYEKAPAARQNEGALEFEQTRLAYKANAAKLGKPDFADAEAKVIADLDMGQQSTILIAAKNPAQFIYALGRSPNRLAQLSLITNPIKLAAEVARIEGARTVPRKEPANIDTPLRGSARLSTQTGDAKEEALIAKVAKNGGDTTELRNYRREKRARAAA